ncbi:hypothetical protein CFR73_11550 [Novacetimonas maltaceti]|uniref:helix-turn-helix domain-containing protein n=1 Tax=Novacetimonas maltaceti TaxID=1203393 RepID=UPI000D724DDA|nr:helix-turn-helix transcriptional regulator [Novacetimonas maltaceti]PYD59432.1 hypothetical protein CFR73_11550 [Novacetimonas maltaceti]
MSRTTGVSTRARAPRRPRRPALEIRTVTGEDPRVVLGRIIHRERIRFGISQEELADRAELDRTYISGMERGMRNPTFLVILRLARVLEISPAVLVELEE